MSTEAGSSTRPAQNGKTSANASSSASSVLPGKLAKNKRLPATMITSSGQVESSKKKGGGKKAVGSSKKHKKKVEEALERSAKLEEKVKAREEKKAKRNRAKNAWE